MPTYDRGCSGCGHVWETVEKMHAPDCVVCPKCGSREARRLPCAPAVRTSDLPAQMRKIAAAHGIRLETREDHRRLKARGIDFLSKQDVDVMTRGENPGRTMIREAIRKVVNPGPIVVR